MIANLALASLGYAEQIAKKSDATAQNKEPRNNIYSGVRKPDLTSIFQATHSEIATPVNALTAAEKAEAVSADGNASIFSDPVAQSQHKAAQVAHSADLQNYDAGKIAAKFGGIA